MKNFVPRGRKRRLVSEGWGGAKAFIAAVSLEGTLHYKVNGRKAAYFEAKSAIR